MGKTIAGFSDLLSIVANYVTFGLALYVIGAFCALVTVRRRTLFRLPLTASSFTRAYSCVIALVLLEAIRQVWDSFHYQHFPLWITRSVLPCLYLVLGNAVSRISRASGGATGVKLDG